MEEEERYLAYFKKATRKAKDRTRSPFVLGWVTIEGVSVKVLHVHANDSHVYLLKTGRIDPGFSKRNGFYTPVGIWFVRQTSDSELILIQSKVGHGKNGRELRFVGTKVALSADGHSLAPVAGAETLEDRSDLTVYQKVAGITSKPSNVLKSAVMQSAFKMMAEGPAPAPSAAAAAAAASAAAAAAEEEEAALYDSDLPDFSDSEGNMGTNASGGSEGDSDSEHSTKRCRQDTEACAPCTQSQGQLDGCEPPSLEPDIVLDPFGADIDNKNSAPSCETPPRSPSPLPLSPSDVIWSYSPLVSDDEN